MSWSRPFDNPIPTAKGKTLVMKDAAAPQDAQRRPADYDRSAALVFPWPGPQNPQQPNVAGDSQGRMRSESAGSRRGLRCWRHRTATTSGRQRLLLGVSSAHVFRSWGKRPPVAGTAADIARTRRSSDWKRLSAGAGTKGTPLHDWCFLRFADLEGEPVNCTKYGFLTAGPLTRR